VAPRGGGVKSRGCTARWLGGVQSRPASTWQQKWHTIRRVTGLRVFSWYRISRGPRL